MINFQEMVNLIYRLIVMKLYNLNVTGMKTRVFIVEFVVIFLVTFVTAGIVTYCWNFFIHGNPASSWSDAFRFAIIFGIICPMVDSMKYRKTPRDKSHN